MADWTADDFRGWFTDNRPCLSVDYADGNATFQFGPDAQCTVAASCDEAGATAADTGARAWVRRIRNGAVPADTYPLRKSLAGWLADDTDKAKANWFKGESP